MRGNFQDKPLISYRKLRYEKLSKIICPLRSENKMRFDQKSDFLKRSKSSVVTAVFQFYHLGCLIDRIVFSWDQLYVHMVSLEPIKYFFILFPELLPALLVTLDGYYSKKWLKLVKIVIFSQKILGWGPLRVVTKPDWDLGGHMNFNSGLNGYFEIQKYFNRV